MTNDYKQFTQQIHTKIGINLNLYKESQMKRRLDALRIKRGFQNYDSYFQALNKDVELLKEFTDRITINVSEFYRNPKRWETLQHKVLPYLMTDRKKLTIWSAACSTGEEPYSLAILLTKYFPEITFEIIATDLDEIVLRKAKQGIYQESALSDLPSELKREFFIEKHGLFHIDSILKRNITFKQHNLLADHYPRNMDLIVCRNVLIYFTDEAKKQVYRNFANALRKNGILFVGSTEQIFNPAQFNFSIFDSFFYEKTR